MNLWKEVLSFLNNERGQFGIRPSVLAMSPGQVLADEARRRQEALEERRMAIAQQQFGRQIQATQRRYDVQERIAQQALEQKEIDRALKREQFEREMEARRTGEFFAERAPTVGREPTSWREYQLAGGEGGTGKTFAEWKKPTKVVTTPTWGEKEYMTGFYDTYIDREKGLSAGEEKSARTLIDRYNEYRKQYNLPEAEIEKGNYPWSKATIRMKEVTAPVREGDAFAAGTEVERLEERVRPPEELRVEFTGAEKDRYGYSMGEMKMARDGTMMEYVGNDKWLPSMR